jgi:3-deoxy-7-phosphoheptulonate synthase
MIVTMDGRASEQAREEVMAVLSAAGASVFATRQRDRAVLIAEGEPASSLAEVIGAMPGVAGITMVSGSHRLTSRAYQPADSVVQVSDIAVGGGDFVVAAGPCAVESREQLAGLAPAVAAAGATLLRGGAFKPRTSPYSFQGLGFEGLEMLREQRAQAGIPTVTEVLEPAHVQRVAECADILQIGTRNMQNYPLLREAGRSGHPVLLKRGFAATVEEWLSAAEYIMCHGSDRVILCERGIRSYEPATRFTLDLSAIPVVKRLSHLPVIVDPSHAAGRAYLVRPLSLAAAAVGADGIIVDVHAEPRSALCDGGQAIVCDEFAELMEALDRVLGALGRSLAKLPSAVSRAG